MVNGEEFARPINFCCAPLALVHVLSGWENSYPPPSPMSARMQGPRRAGPNQRKFGHRVHVPHPLGVDPSLEAALCGRHAVAQRGTGLP